MLQLLRMKYEIDKIKVPVLMPDELRMGEVKLLPLLTSKCLLDIGMRLSIAMASINLLP